jgi:hypothetical protein
MCIRETRALALEDGGRKSMTKRRADMAFDWSARRRCGAILVPVLLVCACASAPEVELVTSGPAPAGNMTDYRLLTDDAAAAAAADGVAVAIRESLNKHGWRESGEAAAWTLEPVYTLRPERVGAYEGAGQPGAEGEWRLVPQKPRWWRGERWAHMLTIVASSEQGDGAYRVTATLKGQPEDPEAIRLLADAAAQALVRPEAAMSAAGPDGLGERQN